MLDKSLRFIWLCVLWAGIHLGVGEARALEKPNVLLIVTDDQGAVDAGCYGATDLVTPAIDSIADRGVRFTQFYAAAPVCSPSRAGLLTGRYPLRAELTGNASSQRDGKSALPSHQVTLGEMFEAAGYATAHIGKWHLGYTPTTMPNAQGFQHSFGHMGGCIDNFSHFFYWQGPNRHDLFRNGREVYYQGQYFADLMVQEAAEFMQRERQQPFFLYFPLNMPHYPYQGDVKWLERFKELPYPRNLYAAFLASCDERIGQMLQLIDDLGMRDQTIVVFQSDNGHSVEERAHFGGGSAGPYRGQKFSLFEGGIRLPGMISWPGHLPQGEVRGQMVHATDWMPTLAKLCGIDLLNPDIDGLDIGPVIRSSDASSPHESLHWYVGGGKQAQWAVHERDWKLIGNVQSALDTHLTPQDKTLFLANLSMDVSESTNLVSQYPQVVQRLQESHADWLASAAPATAQEQSSQDKNGNEK